MSNVMREAADVSVLPRAISECLERQRIELQRVLSNWTAEFDIIQAIPDVKIGDVSRDGSVAEMPETLPVPGHVEENDPQTTSWTTEAWKHFSELDSENSYERTKKKSCYWEGEARKVSVIQQPEQSIWVRIQKSCSTILRHRAFDLVSGSVILLNAACIGAQVEYESWNHGPEEPIWRAMQIIFCLAYTFELLLRVGGQGRHFFGVVDWRWNAFDLFITLASIVDVVMTFTMDTGNVGALGIARVLRIVRVAKIIRVVRYLRNLRAMIFTLLHTLSSLGWALALMAMIMFLFAVAITEATTVHVVHQGTGDTGDTTKLMRYWSSILGSMYTLLLSTSGGTNWIEPASALQELHFIYPILFVLYICFMVFAMFNVLTGFFCEHAFEMARTEKESLIQEQLRRKHIYVKHFRQLFAEGDADGSGFISFDEFERFLEDEQLQAYLAHFNVDVDSAWQIFRLIDSNKDGSVTLEEFISGLLTMKGPAKAIDVKTIGYDIGKEFRRMKRRMQSVDHQLKEIRGMLTK